MDLKLPTTAVIAHRGFSSLAPENTISAFSLALHHNADGIELDAKLSKDGNVVVIHDSTVDRTTNCSGPVNSFTSKELQDMDAGSHFDPKFKGAKIPLLEEVLLEFGGKYLINIELTNYNNPFDNLPREVAKLLVSKKLKRCVLISSFNPFALIHFHILLPQVAVGFLIMPGKKGMWARLLSILLCPCDNLIIEVSDASKDYINKIHARHKKVFVYTVNKSHDLQKLKKYCVDGIITDDPLYARHILQL